jgi:hypothetical protein
VPGWTPDYESHTLQRGTRKRLTTNRRGEICRPITLFGYSAIYAIFKMLLSPGYGKYISVAGSLAWWDVRIAERYHGLRVGNGVMIDVEDAYRRYALLPRLDLRNHSQTGYEWGYAGSGPSQLALAILADALNDDERACALYQEFKFKVVYGLPKDRWELSREQVLDVVAQLEKEA